MRIMKKKKGIFSALKFQFENKKIFFVIRVGFKIMCLMSYFVF